MLNDFSWRVIHGRIWLLAQGFLKYSLHLKTNYVFTVYICKKNRPLLGVRKYLSLILSLIRDGRLHFVTTKWDLTAKSYL